MSDRAPSLEFVTSYGPIKRNLISARNCADRAINSAMGAAYWEITRVIVEEYPQ